MADRWMTPDMALPDDEVMVLAYAAGIGDPIIAWHEGGRWYTEPHTLVRVRLWCEIPELPEEFR